MFIAREAYKSLFRADHRKFSDLCPAPPCQKDGTISVDDLDLSHINPELLDRVRTMLRKHERIWDGSHGTIDTTCYRIEVKPGIRPVRQNAYRASSTANG